MNEMVGKWAYGKVNPMIYEFHSNGEFSLDGRLTCKYTVPYSGRIEFTGSGSVVVNEYKIKGDTLKLDLLDGEKPLEFERV